MNNFMRILAASILVLFALSSYGQTQVDIRSQGRNFDLSGANSTRPLKTGTALPAQCNTGEMFFKTDAPAGQNVYGCTAMNTWTAEVTPASQGSTPGPQSMSVSTAGSNLSVGPCSVSSPCNVAVGNKTYQFTTTGTSAAISTTATCTLYVYLDTTNGNRVVGRDAACVPSITLINLIDAPGIRAFPPNSIPLGTCSAVGNTITACTGMQPAYSRELLKNGPNITLTPNASDGSITIDSIAGAPTPVFASAGLGYFIPFSGADGAGSEIGVASGNQVKYWQIVVPAQMIISKIAGRQGTAGPGGHFSFAIYDATKTRIAQFSTVLDNPGAAFTATTSATTLSAGVYYLGFSTDNTALKLYGVANSTGYENILAAQPAAQQRFFLGADTNRSTGTATITLPTTFSTDTVTPLQEPLPQIVLLP